MNRSLRSGVFGLAALCVLGHGPFPAVAVAATLWEVGRPDNGNAELALAPDGYARFGDDGFFVVGRSDPRADWPYVHPGPNDGWAGGRSHTFAVLFGLASAPGAGECRLVVDLLDTHSGGPPRLRAEINGHRFEHAMPRGAGDESVYGQPGRGREFVWDIPFPGEYLRAGDNEVTLTTLSGSWVLYDSVRMEAPQEARLAPVVAGTRLAGLEVPGVWLKRGGEAVQPVTLQLRHVGDEKAALVRLGGEEPVLIALRPGLQRVELSAPAAERETVLPLSVTTDDVSLVATNVTVAPPRLREMWILPHSHVDIGYTHRQDDVVDIQIGNMEKAMELSRASAGNPPGMQFKWNPEAVWALDHFLRRATPEQREAFLAGVRRGEIGVDGLFGNMLTGLCRPEELAQCLAFGARLSELTGVPVESAAICDVPGWTWGLVTVMGQAGVRYFAIGPNHGDRVGTIHLWDNKPFYWKSPSGRERVLCWVVDNYHFLGDLERHVLGQVDKLGRIGFPYDMSFMFWVGTWPGGGVDNAPPDEATVQKVLDWNAKYAAPRVVIGLAAEYFRAFEARHGGRLAESSGDLTPYWEDGAGSTSRETGLNRASAERLVQAEALFAMRAAGVARPAARIEEAWRNVLLYSEHTWGAWCSISQPDDPFTLDQWKVKQAFALDADRQSREILAAALPRAGAAAEGAGAVDVFNTTGWLRTDLALLPPAAGAASVRDEAGQPVPSQRLASGDLAFLARDVPPYGAKRFWLSRAAAPAAGAARAAGNRLETARLRLLLDETSGAITSLRLAGLDRDFVDPDAPVGLNDYRYVLGTDAAGALGNGPVTISVVDAGPLVATLRIESAAPGCAGLVREVRVVDGLDRVEMVNHVDRLPVRAKDAVHFGFGFNVPGGTVRMETPWAVVRPNVDQLTGACRNWFTVQRWVDVSNADCGITWAPVDAPLMQIGAITANLLGSVAFHEWMTQALESATIYSWAQNNHWHTNYKADQPGLTSFRYVVRPHAGGYSASAAARFGLEQSRPLLVALADESRPAAGSFLTVSSPGVLVETVKASDDGKGMIVRLFGVSGEEERVELVWGGFKPTRVWLTDLTEKPLAPAGATLTVPGYGMVSLRAE